QMGGDADGGVDQAGLGQPGAGGGAAQHAAPARSPAGRHGEGELVGGLPADLDGFLADPAQGGGDQVDHLQLLVGDCNGGVVEVPFGVGDVPGRVGDGASQGLGAGRDGGVGVQVDAAGQQRGSVEQ